MAKEELLTIEGVVDEILPDGRFGVMLDNDCRIIAYTAGKMRRYRIRSIVGDRVHVEMTPYDFSKGEGCRAVFRTEAAGFPAVSKSTAGLQPPIEMPRFAAKSAFWNDLKAAAAHHLAAETERGRPSTGDPRLKRKAAIIVVWFGLSYGALLFAPTFAAALVAALSLALGASALGFSIFHDANHGTLFRRAVANLHAARVCSVLLGPSRHFWVHKHQGLHHRQPNVLGWDDDLETRGRLRLSPSCSWEPRFRLQELKAVLYYGLNTIEWLFWKDFYCLVQGRLNEWHSLELTKRQRAEFFICKGLYVFLFALPPFLTLPLVWAAGAFIVFHFVLSWVLAVVFQLAHLTPEMEFEGVRAEDDWARHQLRTTADFATGSRVATWFTGGLNHQIEHHLFPNVAHTHYPGLRPVVRLIAERHGVECHDLGCISRAVSQHFALLRSLGRSTVHAS